MHTVVTVTIADAANKASLDAAFEDAFAVFTTIDETMNEWKPGSALGKINASAEKEPVQAPQALCEVVGLGLEGARKTNGLFDPTWAALKDVWRFGDEDDARLPLPQDITRQCALVGYREVELQSNAAGCTIRLKREGMRLGLGGLVKGWGVDEAVRRLRARGFKNFWVQAGGDLYFAGKNGKRPWRAGVRDPRGPPDKLFAKLEVENRAFSTSGDYEHFFFIDDVRYHHIIDLRTCWPAKKSRSVTVLAKTATDAEFLTKSAFVLGGTDGLALAEKFGAAAVIVDDQSRVHVSKAIGKRLEKWPLIPGP